jgi:hypothetical protein
MWKRETIMSEDKNKEHEKKVREFKWDDAEDEIEGEILESSDVSILDCANLLSDHLLSHINGDCFSEMGADGMRFVIPVDLSLHDLLQSRFDEKWELESRLNIFEEIRHVLSLIFQNESKQRAKLVAKIEEALPPGHRKKLTPGEVCLEDDAMVIGDESNTVSIEIPLDFVANS